MSATTSPCPKCGEPVAWPENCKACDKKWREEHETARTNQASALLTLGFSEPFGRMGGLFGVELASCLTCGAAVALSSQVEGQTHPLDLHRAWHESERRDQ